VRPRRLPRDDAGRGQLDRTACPVRFAHLATSRIHRSATQIESKPSLAPRAFPKTDRFYCSPRQAPDVVPPASSPAYHRATSLITKPGRTPSRNHSPARSEGLLTPASALLPQCRPRAPRAPTTSSPALQPVSQTPQVPGTYAQPSLRARAAPMIFVTPFDLYDVTSDRQAPPPCQPRNPQFARRSSLPTGCDDDDPAPQHARCRRTTRSMNGSTIQHIATIPNARPPEMCVHPFPLSLREPDRPYQIRLHRPNPLSFFAPHSSRRCLLARSRAAHVRHPAPPDALETPPS
jgi:hypothetical protein